MRSLARVLLVHAVLAAPAAAVPVNDLCTSASVVPDDAVNRFLDTVDIATAGADAAEPVSECNFTAPMHTVWYEWTAPFDGQLLVFTFCTEEYETIGAVWPGTCEAPGSSAGCTIDGCSGGALFSTGVTGGETYRIQVGTDAVPTSPLGVQLCFLGPEQDDADDDGNPDCLDTCTDTDFDGFGDTPLATRPLETCPQDNCPEVSNSDQADKDGDGAGDACDDDEEKDEKTLQEAADDGMVELSGKGCFSGDCVRITIRNPGPRGLVVHVREGDLLVNRDEAEQDLGITRPQSVYVPPGGTVTLEGLFSVCLELDHHAPDTGRIYDVTDNLDMAPSDRASLAALRAVFAVPVAVSQFGLQSAVWAITDEGGLDDTDAAILRAAGLDPAALPPGGFPELLNPNAGSADPVSRYLPGLLANAPPSGPNCTAAPTPLAIAQCLHDRVAALTSMLPAEAVKPKLRNKIGKRVRGVRTKLDAAIAAGANASKAAKRQSAAQRRANGLLRLLVKTTGAGRLPQIEGGVLIAAVTDLVGALGS
jgi:hypothetical protein